MALWRTEPAEGRWRLEHAYRIEVSLAAGPSMNSPAGAASTAGWPPPQPLTRLRPAVFEASAMLKKAVTAGRQLAELKGVAASLPRRRP